MVDCIEKIGHSTIHHGHDSKRVYLMKYDFRDKDLLPEALERLASKKRYSKILVKVPARDSAAYKRLGYVVEATIPRFCNGLFRFEFMSRFLNGNMERPGRRKLREEVLFRAMALPAAQVPPVAPGELKLKRLGKDDAPALAGLFAQVFETYPFPIDDPGFLEANMDDWARYYGILDGDRLVAASGAEIDFRCRNAELTDFAVLPEFRGINLSGVLLHEMEKDLEELDLLTFYTIARASSMGMNSTFSRGGYSYGGTLVDNTNICGDIESMNVWHKLKVVRAHD